MLQVLFSIYFIIFYLEFFYFKKVSLTNATQIFIPQAIEKKNNS